MGAPLPAGQLPLCRGCGAIAPLEQSRCEGCQRELESPRWWVPVAAEQLLWARVWVSFECRACGHRSPIDYLDVDGSVQCLSCGIEQRFENKHWWTALEHAHAVADLCGPHAEGLLPATEISIAELNPHAAIGVKRSAADVEKGEQALRLSASPGAPLCDECGGLLQVVNRAERGLLLRCEPCAAEKRYSLPSALSQRVRALQGVVAPAHEEGRLEAVPREENGVVALGCPTCGAALSVDGSSIVTCQYCKTSSRVNARARGKSQKDVEPAPFWLLFAGRSALRGKLESRAEAARNKARKENQRAVQQRAEARAMDRPRAASSRQQKWGLKQTSLLATAIAGSLGFGVLMYRLEQNRAKENERLTAQRQQEWQATKRVEAEQAGARQRSVEANPGKPFALNLTLDVVKAEGKPLKPGTPCVVYATGLDDSVKELHVTCGSVALYDSTFQVSGMRMMDRELYRSDADQSPAGLRYHDTGQRTNGSEITLDTKLGQAVISSQIVPLFRVELGPHHEAKARAKSKSATMRTK
ncbi:MAG TPA: hypothetical protein VIW29_07335 [Polyangiaceae bacterium]